MDFTKLLNKKQCIAIVCNQWGDTGKGKFVDLFSDWADIVVRGTGGANAGHTICTGNTKLITHLIPSGILYDNKGKISVLGSGVALDPKTIIEEIEMVKKHGCTVNNLKISHNARIVLPTQILIDRISSASKDVGSTGRGIAYVYSDYYLKVGIVANDLLNEEIFRKKLEKNLEFKKHYLQSFDKDTIKQTFEKLGMQEFYDENEVINKDTIVRKYMEYGRILKPFITDTRSFLENAIKEKKKILLEGAQGLLLSIDYGTTRYQTSSDASIEGLAKGCDIKELNVDLVLGITKSFYMTRVGNGPFPSELGGIESEKYCASGYNKEYEKANYSDLNVNDPTEFKQGIAIRMLGDEYGATTGRTRRTGWLDLVALKYAKSINGKDLVLTKVDVLDNCKKIKLCVGYEYTGEEINYAGKIIKNGDQLDYFVPHSEILYKCKPIYKEFKGWETNTSQIKEYKELPARMKKIIKFIETFADTKVRIISVGPDREQTIVK